MVAYFSSVFTLMTMAHKKQKQKGQFFTLAMGKESITFFSNLEKSIQKTLWHCSHTHLKRIMFKEN